LSQILIGIFPIGIPIGNFRKGVVQALSAVQRKSPTDMQIRRPVLLRSLQDVFGSDVSHVSERLGSQQGGFDLRKHVYPFI
jgi:hypothetical protein